jgi:ubiquinone/menaquinone biosynthesis C-methylase UbiE
MDIERARLHAFKVVDITRCPGCGADAMSFSDGFVICGGCRRKYPVRDGAVDFLDDTERPDVGTRERFIYERGCENWGASLHVEMSERIITQWHHRQFIEVFGQKYELYGDVNLDIGCGAGYDGRAAALANPQKVFYAMDMGANIPLVSQRDGAIENLHYIRGDALKLSMKDCRFDAITSFGVFHHTADPRRCMNEAYRVLKKGGSLFIYLYKDHEDNPLKRAGVLAERMLMRTTSKMSVKTGRALCWAISPAVLVMFSWPAQAMKRLGPLEKVGRSFPLHWGTTPASIMGDLQDRLLAPVNHRFSRRAFEELFLNAGFPCVEVVTTTTGHYGFARKGG